MPISTINGQRHQSVTFMLPIVQKGEKYSEISKSFYE